jgi:hypothetical protein
MGKFALIAVLLATLFGVTVVLFPEGGTALLVVVFVSGAVILLFRGFTEEKQFILTIFLVGLAVRLAFGLYIHLFDARDYFGPDATGYDFYGFRLLESWLGTGDQLDPLRTIERAKNSPAWGMHYLVAALYFFTGRNLLAAQSFCAVFGAATAPMVYYCAHRMFLNKGAAKLAAWSVALLPTFIIWSSQLLKDGLVIFLLVLAMTMVLVLQEKFRYSAIVALVLALLGILSIRFYIFYMVVVAVVGSLILGTSTSAQAVARRGAVLVLVGFAFTYFGVARTASTDIEQYANLERIQRSRGNLTESGSGFGEDLDVSTTEGALTALPIGFAYLMFAPFPWEVTNLRQSIVLPEILFWWASIPLVLVGLWYAVRYRLRSAFPVLLFSVMLTLAYSLFQGNVGTAYRQRTQVQVFLFIFAAVGWQIFREERENRRILTKMHDRRIERAIQGRRL